MDGRCVLVRCTMMMQVQQGMLVAVSSDEIGWDREDLAAVGSDGPALSEE